MHNDGHYFRWSKDYGKAVIRWEQRPSTKAKMRLTEVLNARHGGDIPLYSTPIKPQQCTRMVTTSDGAETMEMQVSDRNRETLPKPN